MKIDSNTLNYNAITKSAPQSALSSSSISKNIMGKDDFLKLFLTSLQYQDPNNAMDMNQMMSQMSQLSIIEQVQNMTKAVEAFSATIQANALDGGMKFLGKYVEAVDADGNKITGTVEQVRVASGTVQLLVGDRAVSMNQVTSVSERNE
ncbi:MAG: flagellar hook capping FlgD N-terminal domain-containing protein [Ectobacillus sp.]